MTKETSLRTVHLYTDGACSGNPGPGGWAAILESTSTPPTRKELSGGVAETTNNRMELQGVIAGLQALKEPCVVHLHADSQYVVKGLTEWLPGWVRRGWKNSQNKPVENRDLWEQLLLAKQPHTLHCHWVRGHAGHPQNERADALAVAALQPFKTR